MSAKRSRGWSSLRLYLLVMLAVVSAASLIVVADTGGQRYASLPAQSRHSTEELSAPCTLLFLLQLVRLGGQVASRPCDHRFHRNEEG